MSGSVSSGLVRPAGEKDLPKEAADLRHAFLTDPDGVFAACGKGTATAGLAAGVVRGDVLTLVHLEVAREARGRGLGSALWETVRSYGASRGARTVEFVQPSDDATLGFLLKIGLPVRGVAVRLRAEWLRPPAGQGLPLTPLPPGPALTGWVADFDRETRGFPRSVDWSFWSRSGSDLLAARRRGRPVSLGALTLSSGEARLGPVAAATPEAASELVLALAAEALGRGAARIEVTLPSEARLPLAEALRAGFRLAGSFPLLGGRSRGDLRRYAASPTAFF